MSSVSLDDRTLALILFFEKNCFNRKIECFFPLKLSMCVSGKYTLLLTSKGALNFEAKR